MNEMLDQFMSAVSLNAPRVLAALAILVVGWILALLLSRGLRKLLQKTGLNDRLPGWLDTGFSADPAAAVAKLFFYILMLFVLVGAFQALGLTVITEPLNSLLSELFVFAPKILAAAILLILALILAAVVRKILDPDRGSDGTERRRAPDEKRRRRGFRESAYFPDSRRNHLLVDHPSIFTGNSRRVGDAWAVGAHGELGTGPRRFSTKSPGRGNHLRGWLVRGPHYPARRI